MSRRIPRLAIVVAAAVGLTSGSASPARADGRIEYNRDVRPILTENCFACHGPDSAARKADLRLDRRDDAVEMGAIEPGKPEESGLVERINSTDSQERMPPKASHKTLTAGQKKVLTQWIAQGAVYQAHWSMIAPERPTPPKPSDPSWVRNPIDAFILARLDAEGLKPAPEADRRTLARRLSLDLVGLPPKPAEVEAFVQDQAPDAYEKYVDALMESPAWGEHRGRYWLDAARYADTHGYHFDNFREMWSYRDWVIDAFNANLPFDRFTLDQLAGDLLPDHTLDQQIASGFNRCAMSTNEGGTIAEENLVNYTRDRTETVSAVWLGLTTGCAVCHDHKFDAFSQKEFYELSAFFNNTTQGAYDGNIKDTPPVVVVPQPEDEARWAALPAATAEAKAAVDARRTAARGEFDAWLSGLKPESVAGLTPARGLRLNVDVAPREPGPAKPRQPFEKPDVGDFEKTEAFSYGAWVKLPKAGATGSIMARMDDQNGYRGWDLWLEGKRAATHVIHAWQNNAMKVVTQNEIPTGVWTHVLATYDGSGKPAGVKIYVDGELQPTVAAADSLTGSIKTVVPFRIGQRQAQGKLDKVAISDVRVYGGLLTPAEAADLVGAGRLAPLVALPADQRPGAEVDAVFSWWLRSRDPAARQLLAKLDGLEQEKAALQARGTIAHVMHEQPQEATAYVLNRGEYDHRREQVKPRTPEALPPMAPDLPRNRLGLAKWLLTPEQPLTARVTVNRFWQEVFGQGIVRTTGDLGVSGEAPSHPELLDWTAVEFRDSGWNVKRFFKMLVTSATYRQSAAATPEKVEKDPSNRLLSRGPRFRMDAEMVRDYALAASGLLTRKVGGPSVHPYQPEGVWEAVAMPESNTHYYKRDDGPALYRRSLYTFWKRAAPPASMEVFNAPSREFCTVRRERTNTPLQALVTMNDPQFVEAARALAQRTLAEAPDETNARIDFLARRVLIRPLRDVETKIVRASLDRLTDYYKEHPDDAGRLVKVGDLPAAPDQTPAAVAAWTMLANELLNLDEVVSK